MRLARVALAKTYGKAVEYSGLTGARPHRQVLVRASADPDGRDPDRSEVPREGRPHSTSPPDAALNRRRRRGRSVRILLEEYRHDARIDFPHSTVQGRTPTATIFARTMQFEGSCRGAGGPATEHSSEHGHGHRRELAGLGSGLKRSGGYQPCLCHHRQCS